MPGILYGVRNQVRHEIKKMKHLYQWLFLLSILTMICTMIFPPPHGYSIQRRLLDHPETWDLKIKTQDHTLLGLDEEKSKALLLSFLQQHRHPPTPVRGALFSAGMVAAILSAVGWRREAYLIKCAEPTAAAGC
jgi:hypothetical protein